MAAALAGVTIFWPARCWVDAANMRRQASSLLGSTTTASDVRGMMSDSSAGPAPASAGPAPGMGGASSRLEGESGLVGSVAVGVK